MSNDKNKQVAKILRKVADDIDPPLNQAGSPLKQETSEAAQEIHEAALTSFQTILKDGMVLSLNAAPPEAKTKPLDKDEKNDN